MNESIWLKDAKTFYPTCSNHQVCDVLIIGAGLTGITTAYYLSRETSDVIVVEADIVGNGASGRNTGKVSSQHDIIYHKLINKLGIEKAKAYYTSNKEAIESIENIIKDEHIECDYTKCSSYLYTVNISEIEILKDEFQACLDLNIPCKYVEKCELPYPIKGAILFYDQSKYNPYKYLKGICKILDKTDIKIYEHSPIKEVKRDNGRYLAYGNGFEIEAKRIVLATQFPFIDDKNFYFSRLFPETSYLCCGETKKDINNTFLQMEKPHFTLSSFMMDHKKMLIAGGYPHKPGHDDKPHHQLITSHVQSVFQIKNVTFSWSTQDYMPVDDIAMIGRIHRNDDTLLFASGFRKWGNTQSNIAAKTLTAILIGQDSPYIEMYDPHRTSSFLNTYGLKENLSILTSLISGKFKFNDFHVPPKNTASIFQHNGNTYGMYRDEFDGFHVVNIKCPHMGCTLIFHEEEKSWDCPCHGSRFDADGKIIKGPASYSLSSFEEETKINPHIFMKKD